MLTERLEKILQGIIDEKPDQHGERLDNWVAMSVDLGYDSTVDADADLNKLLGWGLIETDKDKFYSASLTPFGRLVLKRFQILKIIRDETQDYRPPKYNDHSIAQSLPYLNLEEIQDELQAMRDEGLIKGEIKSFLGQGSGWQGLDLDSPGRSALRDPEVYWEKYFRSFHVPNQTNKTELVVKDGGVIGAINSGSGKFSGKVKQEINLPGESSREPGFRLTEFLEPLKTPFVVLSSLLTIISVILHFLGIL